MRLFARHLTVTTAMVALVATTFTTSAVATDLGHQRHKSPSAPAAERFFPVVREAAPGLPGHTVYRPSDLKDVGKSVPVLLWGNGGCRTSNQLVISALTLIAAHGFVVVANGAFDKGVFLESNTANPGLLTEAMDWVVRQDRRGEGDYSRLDSKKIAVMGHSCGGIEALVAAADRRVKSVISANSGFFPTPSSGAPPLGYGRENLGNLHTPTLFMDGGPTDIAYVNTNENYALVNTVPTVSVSNPQGGHSGFWFGLRNGTTADATITREAVEVVVNWLDLTLNGRTELLSYFLGAQCGLCRVPGWNVQAKNF